ncbi:hypothetical protein C0992_008399 [Termitomyces sp. T32_za158]|nr:hypothetical protein C0992_008399 [Termitomyces sp. T32_za158]
MTKASVEMRDGTESLAAFLFSPGGSFSNLESLTIIETDFVEGVNLLPIIVFDHSPRLRKVTFSSPRMFEPDCFQLFLPWTQLTHLYVGGPSTIEESERILLECTQLQVASFECIQATGYEDEDSREISPVEFPHLTDLSLRLDVSSSFSEDVLSAVLGNMLLPNVKKLRLAGFSDSFDFDSRENDLFPVNSLMPLSDGFPQLRDLLLLYADINCRELIKKLSACPLLESLTICLDSIHPITLLKHLSPNTSSSQSDPVPSFSHLTSFTFGCIVCKDEHGDGFDPVAFSEAFVELITSWVTDSSRSRSLQKISLFVCHPGALSTKDGTGTFNTIYRMIQQKLSGLLGDDSVFTARPIHRYDESLSTLGFEKHRVVSSDPPSLSNLQVRDFCAC